MLSDEKNLFINNLIGVVDVMPTESAQTQIHLLAGMFHNLFMYRVPDENPDFRVINKVFKITTDQSGNKSLVGSIKMWDNPSKDSAILEQGRINYSDG